MISPNKSTTTVNIPVAIPTARLILIANVVASADAEIFTILFPIRIALSIFPYLSSTFIAVWALLSPSSASVLRRTLLTVVKAVSAEEKKPDKNNKINNANNCMTPSVSKIKLTPYSSYYDCCQFTDSLRKYYNIIAFSVKQTHMNIL